MEEIPYGEMVRVKKALKILERKECKPLSSNLSKILCKPLSIKNSRFVPAPEKIIIKNSSLKRSHSSSNIKNNKAPFHYSLSHINISKQNSKEQLNQEFKNPLISPGLDKIRAFNEMKPLLSPALRNSLPRLVKPNLQNLKNKEMLSEESVDNESQNQSFFSQTSISNFALKNLIKPTESIKPKLSTSNYFFPDEVICTNDRNETITYNVLFPAKKIEEAKTRPNSKLAHSNSNNHFYSKKMNYDLRTTNGLKKTPEKYFIIKPKNKAKKESLKIKSESNSFNVIPKNKFFPSSLKRFGTQKISSIKTIEKEQEVSNTIARNLQKLKSMPLISLKPPVPRMKKFEEKISTSLDAHTSYSIDFHQSLNKNINNSDPEKNNDSHDSNGIDCGKFLFKSEILQKKTIKMGQTKVLSSRFDFQDNFFAVGCEDSLIRIYKPEENFKLDSILKDSRNSDIATTCVRWKPKSFYNFLLSTQATGVISLWNMEDRKIVKSHEEDNYTYTCDFNNEGLIYVTGGSDTTIRVYDLEIKNPISLLKTTDDNPGHSNRVYNVIFDMNDPNILFSGGWDGNIFMWDLRVGESVNYLGGPMICGDSMDIKSNELLTGSWRIDNQIEIWDIRTFKLLLNVPWINEDLNEKSFIYSCKFSKFSKNYIVAGSTSNCEVRLFDKRNDYQCTHSDKDHDYGIFSLDFRVMSDDFICGTGEGNISYYHLK